MFWRIRGGPPGGGAGGAGAAAVELESRDSAALTIRMISYFGGFAHATHGDVWVCVNRETCVCACAVDGCIDFWRASLYVCLLL